MRRLYTLLAAIIIMTISVHAQQAYTFVGTVTINLAALGGDTQTVEGQEIQITPTGPGLCTFALYHFMFGDLGDIGDIIIDNATMEIAENGNITYMGSVKDLSVAAGSIMVDVSIDGTQTPDGHIVMNIGVSMMGGFVQIPVTFDGDYKQPEQPGATEYTGTVAVYTSETPTVYEGQTVSIADSVEGLCTFTLNNFMFNGMPLGDIVIENVVKSSNPDGSIAYQGKKDNLTLAGGSIVVNVTCQGVEADGILTMQIGVEVFGQTIPVVFTGSSNPSGIHSAITDTHSPSTYYRLNGTRADSDNLLPGVYIRQQGGKASKVIIR